MATRDKPDQAVTEAEAPAPVEVTLKTPVRQGVIMRQPGEKITVRPDQAEWLRTQGKI